MNDFDLKVLALLGDELAIIDPPPADLAATAKFNLAVEALHAEVASLLAADELVGVRATTYDRAETITFTSGDVRGMLTIEPVSEGTARLSGWLVGADTIELRERTRRSVKAVGKHGSFAFEDVQRGLVHLVFSDSAELLRPVITPAIEI